jgi:hypothetical protein
MSEHIIQLLIVERDRLERAIAVLQGTSPKVLDIYDDPTMPDWVKPASKKAPTPAAPKRKRMSAATRRRMAEGQRRRYAAIRAAKTEAAAPKISKKLAEIVAPSEDAEFKAKMSAAMKASWAKRKKAAKKKG